MTTLLQTHLGAVPMHTAIEAEQSIAWQRFWDDDFSVEWEARRNLALIESTQEAGGEA